MANRRKNARFLVLSTMLFALALVTPACGGAGGGAGPSGAGQGLVLVSFIQAGVDNVELNRLLEFRFSEPVNAATITPASIQIRKGGAFGSTVTGSFEVAGSVVIFRPRLPGLCDLSDAGFDADTTYRVQVIGFPEEFGVRNTQGQKLDQTSTWEFHTRDDQDPGKFIDAIAAAAPIVTLTAPATGTAASNTGTTAARERVLLTMSENLDPCTVDASTVTIQIYEVGDGSFAAAPNGNQSGFTTGGSDVSDQNAADVTTWGSTTGTAWPGGAQSLPASIHLVQDFDQTQIVVSPLFGQDPANPELGGIFPDNVLIVVRLSFGVQDFGGQPLAPFAMSFTTENLASTPGTYTILAEGETSFLKDGTTADVNTPRAQSLIQGYLLFAGDGDNGTSTSSPGLPNSPGSGCTAPFQANDGAKDVFDPNNDVTLDSGAINTCVNTTDGSTGVIWEFLTMRIRSGVTVRMIGENPSILLVNGDAVIESNGTLLATGDGNGGNPNAAGGNGHNTASSTAPTARPGGVGVLGAGDGGDAKKIGQGNSNHGETGHGSPTGRDAVSGHGAGEGARNARKTSFTAGGGAAGAGGAGHSIAGQDGVEMLLGPVMSYTHTGSRLGGAVYPTGANTNLLLTPSAGSGGAAGGYSTHNSFVGYDSTGGAGGAGGGFIDITSAGDITIFGTLSAAGGRGGSAASATFVASGGGGGGSGGGIRLLTPNDINLNGGTVSAAGGTGGAAVAPTNGGQTGGRGGNGGNGRLVMEDGDSVISGFGAAIVIPTEGDDGFFRGVFDATRFQGGGLSPEATTDLIFMGPLNPLFVNPVQGDFVVGAPAISSPGLGLTVITIEAQGFQIEGNGGPDMGTASGYVTIGTFVDSGNENLPTWVPTGAFGALDGMEYVQFRITMALDSAVGPFDPGPFIDTWTVRFNSNN